MSMSPANASNRSANDGQKKAEPSETRTNLQRKYEEISSLPPWHAVSEFAKDLYLGRELEMKLLDINVNDLPDYQGRLLTLAVDRLKDCMDKEGDAFNVALAHATVNISCTLDISQRVDERFFTAQDVEKASDALAFTPPEWKGVNFAELAKCLKEKGFNGLERRLVALKERFYSLTDPDAPKKPEESEETPPEFWLETLELLQFLAGKIGPRSFVNLQDLSKVDLDSVWKEVLWMMAPDGFMTKSGERIAASSRTVKSILNDGVGDFGTFRYEVDFKLLYDRKEVGVFQFKVGSAGDQLFKCICLNRAIMEEQFKRTGSRQALYFMCIEGWKGDLYCLYPFEDIVVSKRLCQITIPTSKEELISFLEDGSLNVIKYAMECIHGTALEEGQASSSSTDEAATPLLTKEFISHVFLPPSHVQIVNQSIRMTFYVTA